ncbi:hypothetical protein B566_EDAN007440 [Ephemera danica]|nr:hypothetical protein B566_EDAN007440 [Ephemera danica]
MEVLLRLVVALQSLVRFLSGPIFWLCNLKPTPPCPPITEPLLLLSGCEIARRIRNGQLKSRTMVAAYARRIIEVNPALNCVTEARVPAALEEADAVDALIAAGTKTPEQIEQDTPFLGVPFTAKESCSAKGMSYVVGSLQRKGRRADRDGGSVAYMRAAGAILLGVTSVPELCLSWETNNKVGGATSNPYDTRRTSGGSSGGEAALIGSAGSVIGLGSDVAGSIRIPALYNGIYGHKPTPGVIPITGHYPYVDEDPNFLNYLVIGPMARYAEDLRPMMRVLSGDHAALLRLDEKVDFTKLKVYYMEDAGHSLTVLPVEQSIKKAIRRSAAALHKEHGLYIEHHNMNLYSEFLKSLFGVSKLAFSTLAFYFLRRMNAFIPRRKFTHYLEKNTALSRKLELFLGEDAVLFYPTYPTPAGYHNQIYVRTSGVLYAMAINTLGLPSTHVPVIAGPNQDRLCIAVAEELQRIMGGWIPPVPLTTRASS